MDSHFLYLPQLQNLHYQNIIMINSENTPYEGIHEDSPFVGNAKSSGDLVEELLRAQSTWKYFLLVFSISLVWIPGPSTVFTTSFAGALMIILSGIFVPRPDTPFQTI